MGSNVSTTVNERKTPISASKGISVPQAQNHRVSHGWPTAKPEVMGPAVNNKLSGNYNKNLRDYQANLIEIIKPAVFFSHSGYINRVISFQSSACWRDYFQVFKTSDKLIVIFFSVSWCGFCRYMEPFLDDFATQHTDVAFHKIDVDKLMEIGREFKVYAMPTFLFIKRGIEVDRVIGTWHDDIRRKIESHKAYGFD